MKSLKKYFAAAVCAATAFFTPTEQAAATEIHVPESMAQQVGTGLVWTYEEPELTPLNRVGVGQTFTATTTDPIHVSLLSTTAAGFYFLEDDMGKDTIIKLSLYKGGSDLMGPILDEKEIILETSNPQDGFIRIGTDFAPALEAGETYAITITPVPHDGYMQESFNHIPVWSTYTGTNPYAGGYFFQIGEWYQQHPIDYDLSDFAMDITPAVPEPATYALMAGGLVAVAGAAFAKRRREENAVAANANETQHGAAVDVGAHRAYANGAAFGMAVQ